MKSYAVTEEELSRFTFVMMVLGMLMSRENWTILTFSREEVLALEGSTKTFGAKKTSDGGMELWLTEDKPQ